VIISLLNNTTPLFVCLLAMCFLKERLKRAEIIFMSLTFIAVIVIISGEKPSPTSTSKTFGEAPVIYILLFLNPLLSAAG
jgi:drug/metabolite transporter (DMT)-like permease